MKLSSKYILPLRLLTLHVKQIRYDASRLLHVYNQTNLCSCCSLNTIRILKGIRSNRINKRRTVDEKQELVFLLLYPRTVRIKTLV